MSKNKIAVEGGLRTNAEAMVIPRTKEVWEQYPDALEDKLANFPKYVRRQNMTRFLAQYEIFKKILPVKGSIIECGVYRGGGLMAWAKMSAILEPVNLTRRIYGFDSFAGFPAVADQDKGAFSEHVGIGDLNADSKKELEELIDIYDSDRFLGHVSKVKLIQGDATKTIPLFIEEHQHLVVSLLFLDFDLYEPTKVALEYFIPRMPKGAIVAFDELDNPLWPGETKALVDSGLMNNLQIQRLDFDPYIGFAVID